MDGGEVEGGIEECNTLRLFKTLLSSTVFLRRNTVDDVRTYASVLARRIHQCVERSVGIVLVCKRTKHFSHSCSKSAREVVKEWFSPELLYVASGDALKCT